MTERTWAIVCFSVAALAEFGGVLLLVLEYRESRRSLRAWVAANPKQNSGGSWGQIGELNAVIIGLLGKAWRRRLALGLIVLGFVAGTVGNFLSLGSASAKAAKAHPSSHWWQQTVWHDFVFSSFGSALVAGLFAVLVARLTVRWTTAKDKQAAKHERSQRAAEELVRAFGSISAPAAAATPTAAVDQSAFLFAVSLQSPLLDDLQLAQRVNEVSDLVTNFIDWKTAIHRGQITQAEVSFATTYLPKLMAWVSWLMQSLSAHQTDHPLPDRIKLPELPGLPQS